jgi:Flp pilus assembly protein TadD
MKTSRAPLCLMLLLVWLIRVPPGQAGTLAELMEKGDALDLKQQTKPALAVYLTAEKLGDPPAALLHRIAKQYGLSMTDETTEAAKKAAGEKALSYAQRAVIADPKDADARIALAICYGRLARFQETKVQLQYSRLIKESAEESLRLNPNQELACYVLGSWHYELSKLNMVKRGLARMIYGAMPPASNTAAVEYFKRAIALNPGRMASHVDLGLTYAELGDETAARASLTKGLALPNLDRDDPQVRARGKAALEDL